LSAQENDKWDTSALIPVVEELSSAVNAGDLKGFETALDSVASIRERSLFQEIGKLTRQLHEALGATEADSRIAEVARKEFPDARGRLDQVIAMTDKSAHRTMDLVEEGLPILDRMIADNRSLGDQWDRFRRKQIHGDEFRSLVDDMSAFFESNGKGAEALRATLNEVLMAQDFQDLCGQEIRKVMRMVQDVEYTLINMIRSPGGSEKNPQSDKRTSPAGVADSDKLGQDEADDILSSLGF